MSKNSNSTTMNSGGENQPEYQLKHRIAGAIVLMVLAVVVIPLLLSEPSVEANNDVAGPSVKSGFDFKSRIVPLNINNVNRKSDGIAAESSSSSDTVASATSDSEVLDNPRPALLDLTRTDDQPAGETQSTTVVMTPEDKPAKAKSSEQPEKPKAAEIIVTDSDQPDSKIEVASAAPAAEKKAVAEKNIATKSKEPTVKDGWVVRVGTFSKDANVVSVSSLLSNSGYEPNTTAVSTSLGQSTRVWLGPYANRETADKISDQLKSLTGEKGYVTRSSS